MNKGGVLKRDSKFVAAYEQYFLGNMFPFRYCLCLLRENAPQE